MSAARDVATAPSVPTLLLATTASYPLAVAVQPETEPAVWPLVVALLVGATARAGAGRRVATSTAAQAASAARRSGWLLAAAASGGAADILVRVLLRLPAGAPLDAELVSGATAAVAGVAAVAWCWGARLAETVAGVVEQRLEAGDVRPLGPLLLLPAGAALGAAGWALWEVPATAWRSLAVGWALLAYGLLALVTVSRLRRAALLQGWARSGRQVAPAVTRHWNRALQGLLVAGALVAVAWWTAPVDPVRQTVEGASGRVVAWWHDDVDLLERDHSGAVAGEARPAGGAAPIDDERRVVRVRGALEWLLRPATELLEGEPRPDREPELRPWGVPPQLLVTIAVLVVLLLLAGRRMRRRTSWHAPFAGAARLLTRWWRRLWALLRALARHPATDRVRADEPERKGGAAPAVRRVRRLRRAATPRERVRQDYLRMLERAARQGLPRSPTQSPREYARMLGPRLPEHTDAVDELTARFVEARYSDHPVEDAVARRTRDLSRALRRALQAQGVPDERVETPR